MCGVQISMFAFVGASMCAHVWRPDVDTVFFDSFIYYISRQSHLTPESQLWVGGGEVGHSVSIPHRLGLHVKSCKHSAFSWVLGI